MEKTKKLVQWLVIFTLLVVMTLAFTTGCKEEATVKKEQIEEEAVVEEETVVEEEQVEEEAAPEDITLNVLHGLEPDVLGEQYLTSFDLAAEELGYTIVQEKMDPETYKTKIKVLLASDELPDLWFVWGDLYGVPFIDTGVTYPLNDTINNSGLEFVPSYVQPWTDGNIYNIPYTPNDFYPVMYNKEIFSKLDLSPPTNWEEFIAAIETINKGMPDIGAVGLGNAYRWVGDLLYNELVLREDPMAFKNAWEGKGSFTDEPFLVAAKKVKELVDMGAFQEGYSTVDPIELAELMWQGKIAMYPIGSWMFDLAIQSLGENLGYFMFPKTGVDQNPAVSTTCMFGQLPCGFQVNSNSEFADEAAIFGLRYVYYVNEANSKLGKAPFIKTDTKPENPVHPAYQQFLDDSMKFEKLQPWWYGVVPAEIGEPMRDLSQQLFAGAIEPEAFVEELQKIMTIEVGQ